MGFENNFNGIYFHHHFYLKTGVSRNGLSPGYSERDTGGVKYVNIFQFGSLGLDLAFFEIHFAILWISLHKGTRSYKILSFSRYKQEERV